MTSSPPSPRTRWLVAGAVLVALSCALGVWILARGNEPLAVDLWWNQLLAEASAGALVGFALVMNVLGGSWFAVLVVPLGGALALVLVRRPWSAAYFLAASLASALCVQLLKRSLGRARPEEMLITSDFGSFPSGHAANAATIAVVAVVLFPKVWVCIVAGAWVVLMAFSRTILHAHWLSDTVGGALAGAGAALLVAALFAPRLVRERTDAVGRAASLG